jgi:hypothetical protein
LSRLYGAEVEEKMDAMATLARTGPSPLAAAGHRSSASLRPSASLSFAAASSRSRGRVGLSAAGWSGRAANRVARVTPSRIVASSVGFLEFTSTYSRKCFFVVALLR